MWSKIEAFSNIYSHNSSAALPVDGRRTVLDLLTVLPKCKGLCSVELLSLLLDTYQASFSSLDMLFLFHGDILLWGTSEFVIVKEGAVAPV